MSKEHSFLGDSFEFMRIGQDDLVLKLSDIEPLELSDEESTYVEEIINDNPIEDDEFIKLQEELEKDIIF